MTENRVIKINIPDIHCKRCAHSISLTLKYLNGVESSTVNFDDKSAIVKMDPRIISKNKIVNSLVHLGFDAYLSSVM